VGSRSTGAWVDRTLIRISELPLSIRTNIHRRRMAGMVVLSFWRLRVALA
jgi:hypothetical protein